MIALLASLRLCVAITATWPDVPADRACPAAVAIVAEADGETRLVLAAIAYRESRFTADALNPRTGCWGLYQATGRRVPDVYAQTRRAIAKLREAQVYCDRRGDDHRLCALAGYASGPAGVRGRWYRGPRRVMREAARLRDTMRGQWSRGKAQADA